MISVLVLRRTKEDIATTHKLPEKLIYNHTMDLSTEEQSVYDALFTEARSQAHFYIPILPFPSILSFFQEGVCEVLG